MAASLLLQQSLHSRGKPAPIRLDDGLAATDNAMLGGDERERKAEEIKAETSWGRMGRGVGLGQAGSWRAVPVRHQSPHGHLRRSSGLLTARRAQTARPECQWVVEWP
jgi:hypothetical protein